MNHRVIIIIFIKYYYLLLFLCKTLERVLGHKKYIFYISVVKSQRPTIIV